MTSLFNTVAGLLILTAAACANPERFGGDGLGGQDTIDESAGVVGSASSADISTRNLWAMPLQGGAPDPSWD